MTLHFAAQSVDPKPWKSDPPSSAESTSRLRPVWLISPSYGKVSDAISLRGDGRSRIEIEP